MVFCIYRLYELTLNGRKPYTHTKQLWQKMYWPKGLYRWTSMFLVCDHPVCVLGTTNKVLRIHWHSWCSLESEFSNKLYLFETTNPMVPNTHTGWWQIKMIVDLVCWKSTCIWSTHDIWGQQIEILILIHQHKRGDPPVNNKQRWTVQSSHIQRKKRDIICSPMPEVRNTCHGWPRLMYTQCQTSAAGTEKKNRKCKLDIKHQLVPNNYRVQIVQSKCLRHRDVIIDPRILWIV